MLSYSPGDKSGDQSGVADLLYCSYTDWQPPPPGSGGPRRRPTLIRRRRSSAPCSAPAARTSLGSGGIPPPPPPPTAAAALTSSAAVSSPSSPPPPPAPPTGGPPPPGRRRHRRPALRPASIAAAGPTAAPNPLLRPPETRLLQETRNPNPDAALTPSPAPAATCGGATSGCSAAGAIAPWATGVARSAAGATCRSLDLAFFLFHFPFCLGASRSASPSVPFTAWWAHESANCSLLTSTISKLEFQISSPTHALVLAGEARDSHLEPLKRRLDVLHRPGPRGVPLPQSRSRLSKRGVKMQTHGCMMQMAEEADKQHRKMAAKITERAEVVKNSYEKFASEVQASTSRGTLDDRKTF